MSTELTSELTHFNLVFRLSKVQQLALRVSAVLRFPAAPDVPGIPVICTLSSEAAPNSQKLLFFVPAALAFDMIHDMSK